MNTEELAGDLHKEADVLMDMVIKDEAIFYIIRDVYGRVSIYVIGKYDLENLKKGILGIIGENWIGQVRSINEEHILFEEISKNVQKVVAVDMDLEAPGLATILKQESGIDLSCFLKRAFRDGRRGAFCHAGSELVCK